MTGGLHLAYIIESLEKCPVSVKVTTIEFTKLRSHSYVEKHHSNMSEELC